MLNEWILYLLTTFEPVSSYVRLIDIISTSKCINNIFKALKRSVSRYIDSLKVVHRENFNIEQKSYLQFYSYINSR